MFGLGEKVFISEINLCLEEFLTTKEDLGLPPSTPRVHTFAKEGRIEEEEVEKNWSQVRKRNDVKAAGRESTGS